jgi:hypothetical protein
MPTIAIQAFFYSIDLRSAYVTHFLIQRASGMHSALWDSFGSTLLKVNPRHSLPDKQS